MSAYKQEARTGLFHLKEAVLDVLLDARREGQPLLQPKEIRKRLGISLENSSEPNRSDLILGVPRYLKREGRVESQFQGFDKWQVTEQEVSLRG